MDPKTRKKLEAAVWRNTHRDSRGTLSENKGSDRTVLHNYHGAPGEPAGTCLVLLGSLTDTEAIEKASKHWPPAKVERVIGFGNGSVECLVKVDTEAAVATGALPAHPVAAPWTLLRVCHFNDDDTTMAYYAADEAPLIPCPKSARRIARELLEERGRALSARLGVTPD